MPGVCRALLLGVSWLGLSGAAPAASNPNIIFIIADDLGYGDTGVTGQNARAAQGLPSFATPNIDSIAQQGVRFNNMYAGGTVCSPSRATLLTGMDMGHSIIDRGDLGALRGGAADRTWAQMLQGAGYDTAWFGKWHLSGGPLPGSYDALPTQKGFNSGFGSIVGTYRSQFNFQSNGTGGVEAVLMPSEPTWNGPGGKYVYGENMMTDRAEQYIRQQAVGSQPFAAYVAFTEPHANVSMVPQDHPYMNMPWPKGDRDYAGIISKLDGHVGQLLAALDDPNGDGNNADSVAANTLVIFTSDNGVVWDGGSPDFTYEFFDSNSIFRGHKWQTREGGVRVPFFARWGNEIAPGTVNTSHIGSFEDIFPTFAEMTGQDTPLGGDGRSMLSDLVGGAPSDRRDAQLFSIERGAFANSPLNFSVRVGDWKLIMLPEIAASQYYGAVAAQPIGLYNLAVDPGETTNLQGARTDIVAALRTIMIAEGGLREPTRPTDPPPANPFSPQPTLLNNYFAQYKTWAPQVGSPSFFNAGNWSGGTQYSSPDMPEAQNWNTGPADNWLATMDNATGSAQEATVDANAAVLAIELRGASTMTLHVNAGATLSARNGLRVSSGGELQLHGGEINTTRDLDVRTGGKFRGEGLVNGQQQVIANIPELANLRLFEPRLVNGGEVIVGDGPDAGVLTVTGDFIQKSTGHIQFDLFGRDGVAGADFDQLALEGLATLGGVLEVGLMGGFLPQLGDMFPIITAEGGIAGAFAGALLPQLDGDLRWVLEYEANQVSLEVQLIPPTGDFDQDNDVDGADFLAWQRGFGITQGALLSDGDADNDQAVTNADLALWQNQFGSQQVVTQSVVPEPSSMALLTLAGLALAKLGQVRPKRRRFVPA